MPFRILKDGQKFKRWSWIEYQYTTSKDDRRRESQKVDPESIVVKNKLKESDRAKILNPLIRNSFTEATERKESLTLLRPKSLELKYEKKSEYELNQERIKHKELADQLSFFGESAKPLEPCPVQFFVDWSDQDGKARKHECDDWETSSAYFRFEKGYGHEKAIKIIKTKYEEEYFSKGLVLAFSTHSRRNVEYGIENQWLLVGIIRLDEHDQTDLFLR